MSGQKAITPRATVLTPRLCKAARALLGWTQDDLASYSGVGGGTIRMYEAENRPGRYPTLVVLEMTFEEAGLEFIRGGVVLRELEAA